MAFVVVDRFAWRPGSFNWYLSACTASSPQHVAHTAWPELQQRGSSVAHPTCPIPGGLESTARAVRKAAPDGALRWRQDSVDPNIKSEMQGGEHCVWVQDATRMRGESGIERVRDDNEAKERQQQRCGAPGTPATPAAP